MATNRPIEFLTERENALYLQMMQSKGENGLIVVPLSLLQEARAIQDKIESHRIKALLKQAEDAERATLPDDRMD